MNRKLVYRLRDELADKLPSLGAWQGLGLAVAVLSLVVQERAQLGRMAEGLPDMGSYNTLRQRLKRWVSNGRIDVTAACYEWIGWVWRSYGARRAVLLVDETKLGERLGVMLVSLAYAGRAIPLMWRCYYANSAVDYPQQGQVLLIYGLLAHVLAVLPAEARPLVQMDRGLAHSSAMLRALKRLNVDYLVRVKQTARFTSRRGHSQLLHQLVKVGEALTMHGTLFARDHAIHGTLCLIWEAGQAQAWCLFSNVPRLIGHRYAMRWWQEESFKDLKSGGWQWHTSHLTCPRRMDRLLLVMALAYAWMLSLGAFVWSLPPTLQRQTATRDDLRRFSLFRLGLRFLKRCLVVRAARPVLTFAFPPAPYPLRL